jgi:hypothetical protein
MRILSFFWPDSYSFRVPCVSSFGFGFVNDDISHFYRTIDYIISVGLRKFLDPLPNLQSSITFLLYQDDTIILDRPVICLLLLPFFWASFFLAEQVLLATCFFFRQIRSTVTIMAVRVCVHNFLRSRW